MPVPGGLPSKLRRRFNCHGDTKPCAGSHGAELAELKERIENQKASVRQGAVYQAEHAGLRVRIGDLETEVERLRLVADGAGLAHADAEERARQAEREMKGPEKADRCRSCGKPFDGDSDTRDGSGLCWCDEPVPVVSS